MSGLTDQLVNLGPEMVIAVGACLCLATGLMRSELVRKGTVLLAIASLVIAAWFVNVPDDAEADLHAIETIRLSLSAFIKQAVIWIGIPLLIVAATVPGRLRATQDTERPGSTFNPELAFRGEFFAFLLFSIVGVMLTAGATDLAWLFLALELTSLPTYLLVTVARDELDAQEAGVKYFFLGAVAVAIFLYGFTLIYGVTGTTVLFSSDGSPSIYSYISAIHATGGELPVMLILGFALSILGLAFKIAAFPMHVYAADVYEGANVAVTTFLAFVPKTAGFVAIMLLLMTLGWPLPPAILLLLWVMAALTMTIGNTMALLQGNLKRILAYSSVAHSGYMLIGLMTGPGSIRDFEALSNGLSGVLFYLVAYGLATLAAFAAIGSLESDTGKETTQLRNLHGLFRRNPMLAIAILLSMLSLIGIPPLVGFAGKVYLFAPALATDSVYHISIVVVALINSAIAAVYYLRIAGACFMGDPDEVSSVSPAMHRQLVAFVAALLALWFGFVGGADTLVDRTRLAVRPLPELTVPTEAVETTPVIEPTIIDEPELR